MIREFEIVDYDPEKGLQYPWQKNALAECYMDKKYHSGVVNGNSEGLECLALAFLTLAQKSVPEGASLYFSTGDASHPLQYGSLKVVKKLKWEE